MTALTFAGIVTSVPGEMGASLIRRDWGEMLDDMAERYWKIFFDFADRHYKATAKRQPDNSPSN